MSESAESSVLIALGRLQGTTEMILTNLTQVQTAQVAMAGRVADLEKDKARRDGRAAVVASLVSGGWIVFIKVLLPIVGAS